MPSQTLPFEVRLQSTDPARPNETLLDQILARQDDLAAYLAKPEQDAPAGDPKIEGATVEPLAGFPTGLETFAIVVAVAFVTGVAKGVAEGAGAEVGKVIGAEAGKRIGARIKRWIEKEFPDVSVEEPSEK